VGCAVYRPRLGLSQSRLQTNPKRKRGNDLKTSLTQPVNDEAAAQGLSGQTIPTVSIDTSAASVGLSAADGAGNPDGDWLTYSWAAVALSGGATTVSYPDGSGGGPGRLRESR